MDDLAKLTARAAIALAKWACWERDGCGAESKAAGSPFAHLRCTNCPLDYVDAVADALDGQP